MNAGIAEGEWATMADRWIQGETVAKLAAEYGCNVAAVKYRQRIGKWRERRNCLRLGISWENSQHSQPVVAAPPDDIQDATRLKGKHGRKYYSDLDTLSNQIDHLDSLILECSDAMQLDQLTKSVDRLRERYRIIQGIPGPIIVRGPVERKVKQTPILPLD